jgi:hypothetical protein
MILFRIGCYLLIITCGLHLFGHVNSEPTNETEKQLFEMIETTPLDLGDGNTITFKSLYDGMSLSFSLLFLWTGVLSLFLSYKIKEAGLLKKVAMINTGALTIGSGISLYYFFSAPTSCFIVCLLFFALASWRLK